MILVFHAMDGIVHPLRVEGEEKNDGKPPAAVKPDSLSRSGNGLDSTVVYAARDSLIYNFDRRTVDLYGKARVDYKDMKIEGPRISLDQNTRTVHAWAAPDTPGAQPVLPVFTDNTGSFTAEVMDYNYRTRLGKTIGVASRGEGEYYTGSEVKRLATGELYIRDGIYTTCDLEEPHYWFAGRNMKIIPDERIVARPFIMYIHPEIFSKRLPKIPLLPLPFMSAPISNKRSSGFLFPLIGSDGDRGAYFSNLGYFWALSDYTDLRLEGDAAFNGSWRLGERFRYKRRGLFDGMIEGEYESYLLKHPDDPEHAEYENWNARILHHQEFDPTAKLDLNMQYIGGDRFYDVNSINPESIITDQATSYASFSKSWAEGRRVLSVGYQSIDYLQNDDLTQTATVSLYQDRIYPFRPRRGWLSSDWESRFSLQPRASVTGQFSNVSDVQTDLYTADTGFDISLVQPFAPGYRATFTQGFNLQRQYQTKDGIDDLDGYRVRLPFTIQSTLFRYLNLTPSLTYTHYSVNSTIRKDATTTYTVDDPDGLSTTVFSVDAQTRLYGAVNTGLFDRMFGMKALRHTLIPTVSFIYNPDYWDDSYGYTDSYADGSDTVRYSRFGDSLYPDSVLHERREVRLNIQNLFHGKFRSEGASAADGEPANDRVYQLLSLTGDTGYNFADDSFPLDYLRLTASSSALSPGFLMSAGATYDFYAYDLDNGDSDNHYRIDKLNIDNGSGLLRLVEGFVNMSMSFGGNLRSQYDTGDANGTGQSVVRVAPTVDEAIFRDRYSTGDLVKFSPLLPWSFRTSLYLSTNRYDPTNPTTTALLNSSAKVSLSRNWQVGFSTGYDLRKNEFIYPAILVYRDLHDFQFGFQWVPSGEYKSYQVEIAMKPPQLKDLRIKASGSLGRSTATQE